MQKACSETKNVEVDHCQREGDPVEMSVAGVQKKNCQVCKLRKCLFPLPCERLSLIPRDTSFDFTRLPAACSRFAVADQP